MKKTTNLYYRPVSEQNNLKNWRKKAKMMFGIILLAMMILSLLGCVKTEYVYIEPQRVPITCHRTVKTPLEIAQCLEIYKEHYNRKPTKDF